MNVGYAKTIKIKISNQRIFYVVQINCSHIIYISHIIYPLPRFIDGNRYRIQNGKIPGFQFLSGSVVFVDDLMSVAELNCELCPANLVNYSE